MFTSSVADRIRHGSADPVTGDRLTGGEYISWLIQGVIRRWAFLLIITGATAVVWLTNNPMALTWWNLSASYLALMIESIVGIAMFSQTKRDALALREVRAMARHVEQIAEALLAKVDAVAEDVEQMEASEDGEPERVH